MQPCVHVFAISFFSLPSDFDEIPPAAVTRDLLFSFHLLAWRISTFTAGIFRSSAGKGRRDAWKMRCMLIAAHFLQIARLATGATFRVVSLPFRLPSVRRTFRYVPRAKTGTQSPRTSIPRARGNWALAEYHVPPRYRDETPQRFVDAQRDNSTTSETLSVTDYGPSVSVF
jgi:hypothetical protein